MGTAPNTVKSYARALALWWTYLGAFGLEWDSLTLSDVGGFLAWLRSGDGPDVISIEPRSSRFAESTVATRLELIEQRVEEDRVRPGCGDVAQARCAVIGGAGDRDGGEVAEPEVAVPALESVADPVPGLAGVDGDVDALGNGETAGVAVLPVQFFPGSRGLLGEFCGSGGSGADEAVRRAGWHAAARSGGCRQARSAGAASGTVTRRTCEMGRR
jgi:Phage integrase, N-terminal SAM-like domain